VASEGSLKPIDELLAVSHLTQHVVSFVCTNKQPSELNTYADIEAAYECLEHTYGVQEENVVLYGQSVGSGPTLDLATRKSNLRGVVLHSPILSGLRVMYPVKRTYWFDIYKVRIRSQNFSVAHKFGVLLH
jgi:cephalosporin-C deacetylase-like acetyl esterase